MKENFPNLVKKIDMQVREAQRLPNKLDPKWATPRCIIIKMPKVKDKENILKVARNKELPTKEFPLDYQMISQKKLFMQEGTGKKYSK